VGLGVVGWWQSKEHKNKERARGVSVSEFHRARGLVRSMMTTYLCIKDEAINKERVAKLMVVVR
jgi:hypothetical protein